MRSLLLVDSFDLHPSNQYTRILVRVIPSCFRFVKICLCRLSLLSGCSPRYLISSSWGSCTLFIWTGGHVSLRVVIMAWKDLDPLAFILHFKTSFRLQLGQFAVSMKKWLSVAATAVSSAKVDVVDSGEVGRSAVYRRYNNGPRTLPWGTPALSEDNFVYSVSTFTRKCLLCK
jgi:hypothetical protein